MGARAEEEHNSTATQRLARRTTMIEARGNLYLMRGNNNGLSKVDSQPLARPNKKAAWRQPSVT